MRTLIAFLAGLLFGAGLTVSRMINPAKILDFLDVAGIARGAWDPSLALVMGAALFVTTIGYRLTLLRNSPLLAPTFALPTRKDIDLRLIVGSALFGLGWGMVGFCPGPALAALATGAGKAFLFVAAMLLGMGVHRLLFERVAPARGIGLVSRPAARRDSEPSARQSQEKGKVQAASVGSDARNARPAAGVHASGR